MGNSYRMSNRQKKLINIIGKLPDTSPKELANYTKYKWVSTVVKKLEYFKEKDIVWGPYYRVDYGKLCSNPLHILICILEFNLPYSTVISFLTVVESLKWIYPVLSPHKNLLHVGFISSNDEKLIDYIEWLKTHQILIDYVARSCASKWIPQNPDFFETYNPSLDNLLDESEIPDMSLGVHDTVWNECDIRILPYLQVGFKGTKLIEILKAERRLHNRKWKYDQIKYSRKKMVENELIHKNYSISPFSRNKCVHFVLFINTDSLSVTTQILHNFARGKRVYKEYTLCDTWGMLICQSHPQFFIELMEKLDEIDEIKKKELYQLRSYPGKYFFKQSFEDKYYNFDDQTLRYPYDLYKEIASGKIEEMGD